MEGLSAAQSSANNAQAAASAALANVHKEHHLLDLLGAVLPNYLKVIRKFFLKHNKSFRWHLGDYKKHDFFPFEGL